MNKKDRWIAVGLLFAVIFSVSAFAIGREGGMDRLRREYAAALVAPEAQSKSSPQSSPASTSRIEREDPSHHRVFPKNLSKKSLVAF